MLHRPVLHTQRLCAQARLPCDTFSVAPTRIVRRQVQQDSSDLILDTLKEVVAGQADLKQSQAELKQSLADTNKNLADTNKNLAELKQSQADTNKNLADTNKNLVQLSIDVRRLSEEDMRTSVEKSRGVHYAESATIDNINLLLKSFDARTDDYSTMNGALQELLQKTMSRGSSLDGLVAAVDSALQNIAKAGIIALPPSNDFGAWVGVLNSLPAIKKNDAAFCKVERLTKTLEFRDSWLQDRMSIRATSQLSGCASYVVGLVVYLSQMALFNSRLQSVKTLEDLASAMPPEVLQIDCIGSRASLGNEIGVYEIGEMKCTKDSDQWQKGFEQLTRSLP